MNKTFNDILEQMLGAYEANPEKGAGAVVSETLKDLGASEECQLKAEKAGKVIDAIQEKATSLAKAKEEDTRERWMTQQMLQICEGRSEEEAEQILNVIKESTQKNLEQQMTEEA